MIALVESIRAGLWTRQHLAHNALAGMVVGVVALPLSLAFAIASGARPEQGLYTAIIAGLATSLFGGTRAQISGPTGAFIAVLAVITAQHGIAGLQVATLMAGLILLTLGLTRMGSVIKYIPDPVIIGFTAGIGIVIFVGQWKDFFGLQPAASGIHFHEKLWALVQAVPTLHWPTLLLGLTTLGVMLIGPRVLPRVPAPLLALCVATLLQGLLHLEGVATIGTAFGGIPRQLPSFAWPQLGFGQVIALVGPAFTIALLGAIESLLSAVVADGMAGTEHDSNQELVGQGVANVLAPLFGGFAATGAIARTATNIRNGATSPLAGVVHCAVLVAVILALAPWAAQVPLCGLAAILFVVAWNMAELPVVFRMVRIAPRPDVVVLLLTFGLTVFVDLVVAVNVGVILAALLFMRRMAQTVSIEREASAAAAAGRAGSDAGHAAAGAPAEGEGSVDTLVYNIDGPFFFGAAEKLERTLSRVDRRVTHLVLRMGKVPFIDATGIRALESLIADFRARGARVELLDLRDNVRAKLERAGVC